MRLSVSGHPNPFQAAQANLQVQQQLIRIQQQQLRLAEQLRRVQQQPSLQNQLKAQREALALQQQQLRLSQQLQRAGQQAQGQSFGGALVRLLASSRIGFGRGGGGFMPLVGELGRIVGTAF